MAVFCSLINSEPLLCGPDEDVVHHHVWGAAQHVAHLVPCVLYSLYYCIALYRGGDVLGLETLHGAVDGGHRRRVVRVHCGLELGLDQA